MRMIYLLDNKASQSYGRTAHELQAPRLLSSFIRGCNARDSSLATMCLLQTPLDTCHTSPGCAPLLHALLTLYVHSTLCIRRNMSVPQKMQNIKHTHIQTWMHNNYKQLSCRREATPCFVSLKFC